MVQKTRLRKGMAGVQGGPGEDADGTTSPKRSLSFAQGRPRPGARAKPPPHYLSKDAKQEWKRINGALLRAGVTSSLDTAILIVYCTLFGQWKEIAREIKAKGSSAALRSEQRRVMSDLSRSTRELALTPLARHRVALRPGNLEDQVGSAKPKADVAKDEKPQDDGSSMPPDLLSIIKEGLEGKGQ